MECPRRDFHMHTRYTDAEAGMEVATIVPACERLGLAEIAITDHMHGPEQVEVHRAIRREVAALRTPIAVYMGVELDILEPDRSPFFSPELRAELGFDVVLAGMHFMGHDQCDWARIVPVHHRNHLRVCEDPLIDVLAHPYWFPCGYYMEPYNWPMLYTMDIVPDSMVRELAAASRETGTAIEINACSSLEFFMWPPEFKKSYREYIGRLAAAGAIFSVGSDAHQLGNLAGIAHSWKLVEDLGIPPERIWKPLSGPVNTPVPG